MKNVRGQALIEAIMAMGIALVSIVAVVSLATKSVENSGQSSRQALATGYATEAIAWLKTEKAKGWKELINGLHSICSTFPPTSCTRCINTLAWSSQSCTTTTIPTNSEYTREITFGMDASGNIPITVEVKWWEGGRHSSAKQAYVFVER